MAKIKIKNHYIILASKLRRAGAPLYPKNRKNFTPAEKGRLTKRINDLGDFITNRNDYNASRTISKREFNNINRSAGKNIFVPVKTGKNKYKIFSKSRFGEKERISIKRVMNINPLTKRKLSALVISKKPTNKKSDLPPTTITFYRNKNADITGAIEYQNIKEQAYEIYNEGGAIRVITNGAEWSKVFNTPEELESYADAILDATGYNVFLGMQIITDDRKAPPKITKRRRLAGQKTTERKSYDE